MSLPALLLTGCNGQLGRTFSERWTRSNLNGRFQLVKASRAILDLSDADSTASYLTSVNPSVIVNAAAYTRVDEAESDRESAYLVNDIGVGILVSWCQKNSCKLIHLSTDFVFDGLASVPYKTDAITNPLGVYGLSKLGGEQRVLHRLPTRGFVIRTSWLYSEYAPNFVKTMLRLMSDGRDIRVINDQIGSPTSAHSLVEFIYYLIRTDGRPGIHHFTDGGQISWYDFAVAIKRLATDIGLLKTDPLIIPIPSLEYPTAASRPAYSVLDLSSVENSAVRQDWDKELYDVLCLIKASSEPV